MRGVVKAGLELMGDSISRVGTYEREAGSELMRRDSINRVETGGSKSRIGTYGGWG